MPSTSKPHCILVTGADGFVGRWLLEALSRRLPTKGHVVGAARDPLQASSDVEWVRLDVTDERQVDSAIAAVRPTCVIHLAAIAALQEARQAPRRTWAVNFEGTVNLTEAVLAHVPTARFLLASSSEVYGGTFKGSTGPLDEQALLDPLDPYASSKAAADLLVGQMAREGLRAIRFRPFNHTGPGQRPDFVIPAFAAQIAQMEAGKQEPVIRVGNLEARRDFLDVRDVVEAYAAAALCEGERAVPPGTILNIASGVPRRIGDVLQDLVERASITIRVEVDPTRLRRNDVPLAYGNAGRARALLGWTPAISWQETIGDILDHWRKAHRACAG